MEATLHGGDGNAQPLRNLARRQALEVAEQRQRAPEQYQQCLSQMAQSRGVPGTNPGSGSGYSQGGSQAPMSVRGPGGRQGPGERGRRNGRMGQANSGFDDEAVLESIEAGAAEERGANAGYIVGVPEEYREEAEAYFRRIADEHK